MIKHSNSKLLDITFLFISKFSSIIVGLLFLPIYNKLLGIEKFGIVTIILTIQALAIMLDFGTSVIVSRDTAIHANKKIKISDSLWHHAEVVLTILYIILLFIIFLCSILSPSLYSNISFYSVTGILLLTWIIVLQNLSNNVLIAAKEYSTASIIQLIGILIKALFSVLILIYVSQDIEYFIYSQLIITIIHYFVTKFFCYKIIMIKNYSKSIKWVMCIKLLKKGKSLLLFSISGALVLQFDKILISNFISAIALAPYYLASSLCMTPISSLAGPLMQYFQPKIIHKIYHKDKYIKKELTNYVIAVFLITITPSFVLWYYAEFFITLWLGNSTLTNDVILYTKILLPGVTIGALGYIPYVILISAEDFKFQAILSTIMTIITLFFTFLFSIQKNISSICFLYSLYHIFSTLSSWCRCIYLRKTKEYGIVTIKILSYCMLISFIIILIINIFV